MMALVKNENNPRVIIFRGSVMMLKIGFTRTKRIDNTIAPIIYAHRPPLTTTPLKDCAVKKSATA
jgi:hypothetical protein